ncbi:hypothetical protein F4692_001355 [Nocardioides cavernae]|uniref:ANTAR domain-containing protein n=1 Tax=Nocardioides cavernae TaxID=1921566 RepID=A0A7Y9KP12_9ACTN|nr:ANTAR domain-containing protein [Nocardioides cavernae]NYE36251.1 hypothetical protein [Nocardioides cavernae]
MEPLPATAEALDLLVASGDEGVRARVAWIGETVLEVVPHADAFALWFTDEDLTLVHIRPLIDPSVRASQRGSRTSVALSFATGGRVIAVVTIYSDREEAFAGRVEVLERRLGAVPGASLLDHDLALRCRRRAELAPAQLRSRALMDAAIGTLMGAVGLSLDQAEAWLADVARDSGRTVVAVAVQVVAAHHAAIDPDEPPTDERT